MVWDVVTYLQPTYEISVCFFLCTCGPSYLISFTILKAISTHCCMRAFVS